MINLFSPSPLSPFRKRKVHSCHNVCKKSRTRHDVFVISQIRLFFLFCHLKPALNCYCLSNMTPAPFRIVPQKHDHKSNSSPTTSLSKTSHIIYFGVAVLGEYNEIFTPPSFFSTVSWAPKCSCRETLLHAVIAERNPFVIYVLYPRQYCQKCPLPASNC